MLTVPECKRAASTFDSNRGENVCRAPTLSPETGLAANADAVKSIMVKFGSDASDKRLEQPKLTPRNKIPIFVFIFTGEYLVTHSPNRIESRIPKILSSCSTELRYQNYVKTDVLSFIRLSWKVARICVLGKG